MLTRGGASKAETVATVRHDSEGQTGRQLTQWGPPTERGVQGLPRRTHRLGAPRLRPCGLRPSAEPHSSPGWSADCLSTDMAEGLERQGCTEPGAAERGFHPRDPAGAGGHRHPGRVIPARVMVPLRMVEGFGRPLTHASFVQQVSEFLFRPVARHTWASRDVRSNRLDVPGCCGEQSRRQVAHVCR